MNAGTLSLGLLCAVMMIGMGCGQEPQRPDVDVRGQGSAARESLATRAVPADTLAADLRAADTLAAEPSRPTAAADERPAAESASEGRVRGAWQAAGLTDSKVLSVVVDAGRGTVWAGTETGRVFQRGEGAAWQAAGSPDLKVRDLMVDDEGRLWAASMGRWLVRPEPGSNRAAVAARDGGVFLYEGGAWTFTGLKDMSPRDLYQAPDGRMWAAVRGGVYRYDTRREDWAYIGLDPHVVHAVAVHPETEVLYAAKLGGILRYQGEDRWMETGLAGVNIDARDLLFLPDGTLYAAIIGGVYRSTDGGQTWEELNKGLTERNVQALTIDARGTLYAATQNGIYRSTDEGLTWEHAGLEGVTVHDLASAADGTVYAATDEGLYRSIGPAAADAR